MGITTVKKSTGGGGTDSWGTPDSFFLVFFPQDHDRSNPISPVPTLKQQPGTAAAASSPLPLSSSFRRTRPRRLLLSRAQSILSICALLLSLTLLLFALSSLDHSPSPSPRPRSPTPRPPYTTRPSVPFAILWRRRSAQLDKGAELGRLSPPFALQGMGVLHRRGSHSMPDLVVGHVPEDTTDDGLRLFLRALHRSGLTARSDVVLVLPDRFSLSRFGKVIEEEGDAFLRLLDRHLRGNHTNVREKVKAGGNALSFEAARFVRKSRKDKESREPLWGKRTRGNYSDTGDVGTNDGPTTRASYGSVVSFDVAELDPEGSLSGFLDHVPMSLRRWSCYSMLLGRLRRNFKHVMLVDVKNWVVLSDPFVGVRNRSSETVVLWGGGSNADEGKRHGRGRKEAGSETAGGPPRVSPGAIVGGMRGVRRVAEAMQMEIVRAAMHMQQQKQKKGRRKGGGASSSSAAAAATTSLGESGVMSQLVGKELLLKNVELVVSGEEDSAAATVESTPRRHKGNNNTVMLSVGSNNNNNNQGEIRKLICSSETGLSEIYSDC